MAGRRRGAVLGLLVVVAAACVLALRGGVFGGGTPTPEPEASGPLAGSGTPAAPPRPPDPAPASTPPSPGTAPEGEAPRPDAPPASPLPATDVAVRATLHGFDAAALADARVFVVGSNRNGRPQVAGSAAASADTVAVAVEGARVAGLSGLRVAVVAPGRPTAWTPPLTIRDATAAADVHMPEGVLLEGRVLTPQRAPVGGLPLVVTSAWGRVYAVFGEDLTFEGSVGRGTAAHPLFFTRTTTDAAGRFALRVPPGAAVAVLADHEAWKVDFPEDGYAVGPEGRLGLDVRASPAFTVYAEIVSASGGTAVAEPLFGLDRGRELGFNFSETFPTSEVRVTSARAVVGDRKVAGLVRASARGFDPKSERFLLEGGQVALRVRLSLEPRRAEQDAARIRIDVADASGRPVVPEGGQRPYLRIRRLEEGSTPGWVSDAPLRRIDDTTLEGEVPEGEWNVQLVLPQHFLWIYATDATLTFAAGRQTRWRAVLPDGGPLTVRWRPDGAAAPSGAVSLGICPAAKVDEPGAWAWESHPDPVPEATFARWPEGAWVVVVGAQGAKEPRRTVTVRHGVPALADFTK